MGKYMRPKTCPTCEQKSAIATKICINCGFDFYNAKRLTNNGSSCNNIGLGPKSTLSLDTYSNEEGKGRRTRAQRTKPNFYDSRQFDKKKKKRKKGKKNVALLTNQNHKKQIIVTKRSSILNQGSSKPKEKHMPPVLIDEEEDIMSMLSEEQLKWAAKLLEEINRKLCLVQWKPPA